MDIFTGYAHTYKGVRHDPQKHPNTVWLAKLNPTLEHRFPSAHSVLSDLRQALFYR